MTVGEIIGFADVKDVNILRMLIAEFLGTFFLVAIGIFACVQKDPVVPIAFAFGVAAACMIQGIGQVSGGHINPAVTMGFLIVGEISILKSILYMIAQCLGSIAAAAVIVSIFKKDHNVGITEPNKAMDDSKSIVVEAIITFMLVFAVKSFCDPNREEIKPYIPVSVGAGIAAGILAGGDLTGGSMNPARSLGPAVVNNKNINYIYWAGPMLGSILAALIYKFVMRPSEQPRDEE